MSIRKNIKTYQTVENQLLKGLENAPSKGKTALIALCKEKLNPSGYSLYRKYKAKNFPLYRCEGWFIDACIIHLNMQKEDFQEPQNAIHSQLLTKVGLTQSRK